MCKRYINHKFNLKLKLKNEVCHQHQYILMITLKDNREDGCRIFVKIRNCLATEKKVLALDFLIVNVHCYYDRISQIIMNTAIINYVSHYTSEPSNLRQNVASVTTMYVK